MPLLSEQDRQTVRSHLAAVTQPVTLLFFTQAFDAPETVMLTKQVLDEVVSLSEHLTLEEVNLILERDRAAQYAIDRVPAVVLLRNGEDTRMRFLGAPAGYEFTSLIEAIILAGTGESGLSDRSRALIAERATSPTDIKVFVTPTCPHCPRAVTLAHRMAVENANVTATCVEASEFIDLARRHHVTGVPKTIVEGTGIEVLGAVPEDDFVTAVLPAPATSDQAPESTR